MDTEKKYGSDNRRKLYDNLSKDGFDLGTFEDFDRNMNDKEVRRSIHEAAIGAGWDLPDYDQFDRDMAVRRMKIGGEMQEVDHATYDDFLKRHPSGTNVKPKPQPKPQPKPASMQPAQAPVTPAATTPPTPTVEAEGADDPVLGTPWGTEGSATGKSKKYKGFAPGQVRETGDPGIPDYGIPYRPYTQMSAAERDRIYRDNDYAVTQIKKMQQEEKRRNQPLVDTGIPEANNSVIKTQGQWEDDFQKSVKSVSDTFMPAVDKAVEKFDKEANEVFESTQEGGNAYGGLPTGTASGATIFGSVKESNKAKDPDKILNYLQQQMEGVYKDESFINKIGEEADRLGIDRTEYLEKVIKPQIESDLSARLTDTLVKRELPKFQTEYIIGGLSNSIVGMLADAFLETKGQRAIKNQAEAMTEEGNNPYYNPDKAASLAKMGVSFAADAPFFGVYGRVSGQVAKNIAERQIQRLISQGLSEGAARSVVGTALENSVGARMKNYLMQHIIGGSLTLGGYNATSEAARQIRDKEGLDLGKIAGSTLEGLATGAAFGATGGFSQALSQPLSGFAKLGAKAAGFGAEAGTLYTTEELAKLANGDEAFTNPFGEGYIEAMEKLGVMKLSGGHMLGEAGKKITRAREVGAKQVAAESLAELLSPARTGVKLSQATQDYIRNTVEGKNLMESLSQMHPAKTIAEVNGKKSLTKEGEALRQQLAENYDSFMNNKDIPAESKQEVAKIFGGIYRPGLETGADIIQNEDGSVLVKTRDKDGNCIQDIKFDNLAEAEQWRANHLSECKRNDAVNMWNSASNETKQEIVDIIREQVSGEKQAEAMLDRANGMKQNRMRRELEKYNQFTKEHEGRALTDEEARNYIQMVIRDGDDAVFNDMYQLIHDKAYPKDMPDVKRSYWEGQQLDPTQQHFAQIDAQLATERLMLYGQRFADEVMAAAEYPDEKIAELAQRILLPDTRGGITTEQFNAAVDYYNKMFKVNGMFDETLKNVDNKVKAENAYIRANTHADSKSLISATCAEDPNGSYFVTAGHFQVTPDGKLMPTDNSGMVILRDKATGEIKVVNPSEVTVDNISDPNLLIAENESMEGLRGDLMKQADDQIDLHPDTPTDAVNGDIYTGADGNQYMAMQIEDEQGNPVWTKVAIDEGGNIKGEPMPFDMAEYRKAKSDEIDAAERPQTEEAAPIEGESPVIPEVENNVPETEEVVPETPEKENGGGINTAVDNDQQATVTSKIPVDEKGNKLYEQAKPEDTLADLTAEFGEEKAQQMISRMAENTAKALDDLQKKDTSGMTDMNKIAAHEKEIQALQGKLDFWQSLIKKPEPAKEVVETPVENVVPETPKADEPVVETPKEEPVTAETPVEEKKVEPQKPVEPEKPAEPTAEQKVAQGTIKNNIGKRLGFQNQDGTQSEIVINSFKGDDMVEVTRQDYDAQGNPKGNPYKQDLNMVDVGNSIVNGYLKPVLSTEEKLRNAYKGKLGMQNVIDVLTEEEQRQMLDAIEKGDKDALNDLTNELVESHREDIILNERNKRNDKVNRIMDGTASREEKLRRVRKEYEGFDDAVIALSDEAMQPTSLEEYIADLHSRVPKPGEGPIAYFTYKKDGREIVGMQGESGHGDKYGGDTKGYLPWLAPKGKGMSLIKYAEIIHSQLPEKIQEQFDVQEVRNAIQRVFGAAERPSDITTMMIKRGVIQAEQAARRMEEMWIDGPSYQKVADEQSFASRLKRGKDSVNTEPTDGQKEAGNYKKGHISFGGYDFTIENPEGSVRRGKDKTGREWEQKMNNTYGYILGKYGKDGDHLDMFINDAQDLDNWNGTVYVVDQIDPKTGKFDEHKVLYGFDSLEEAKKAYLSNYEEGWQGLGRITGVTKEGFDQWLDSSKRKMKEFADHSIAKEHMVESEHQGFDSALKQLNTRGISINDPDLMKQYGLTDLTLSKTGDHVTLNKIVVADRGQGNGTRFMEDLARLADEKGWTLALTPSGGFGAKSIKRLKDFYKRFGFVDNKGRNPDFSTRESMIRRPKDYEAANTPERQEQILRDAVVEHLRSKGVEVSTDWQLGQKILDDYNGVGKLSASKKRAVETASLNPKEGSPADISTADGAKIQKKLESYANKLEKVSNLRKNFLDELAEELGATSDGSKSKYATFITKNGDKLTIRLGNHNATVSNFDYRGEDNGVSIVVSRRENEGVKNDGDAHIVEAFYPEIALRKAYGKPLAEIVRSINEALNSGKYTDTTGLAEMEEVNADEIRQHKVYHGTGAEFDAFDHSHMYEGEGANAFGWGTYVTEVPKIAEGYANTAAKRKYRLINSGYGDKEVFYKGKKIDLNPMNLSPYKLAYDLLNSEGTVKMAIRFAEKLRGLSEETDMKDTWQKTLDILNESKKSDFTVRKVNLTGKRYVYDVEIPDDTGDNYLNYYDKLTDEQKQQIADRIYKSEYFRSKLKNVFDREFDQSGIREFERKPRFYISLKIVSNTLLSDPEIKTGADLYSELSKQYGGPQEASAILHDAGFVGLKYPTNTLHGGNKDGSSNFVIFNEPDAKITDRTKFFKTSDGHAYGYTYNGKIYVDPRIATTETPIHEYGHLWCEMKRETAPEEWKAFKKIMLNDKMVKPIIDKVKNEYPELAKKGKEDDFVEEVITQFSGKRGNERLHEIVEEIAKEKGGIFGKAEAVAAMQRLKNILNRFWEGVANMMGWKYRNANQIADRIMSDMLNGVDPRERMRQEARRRIAERENLEAAIRPQKVTDQKTLDELDKGKTVKRYRAMQLIDGKLYPPMSAKVDGEMRKPTEIGVWEQSEERPDLIKNGKFVLNKGQKGQSNVPAAYNPYFHTSTSGLNDQFTSAYRRPELVVVEVEIPESELTSGYKAEGAKDAVGNVDWHSGVVNSQLPEDRQRQVTLSRYSKVNRVVPDSEVADMIAKQLDGTNIEIPFNVVTPQLRQELEKRGVKISDKPSGLKQQKVSEPAPTFYSNAQKALEDIKQEKGTPEQWLKMIEKQGGLKAGEDKWLGLSDWLKEQQKDKKSITKQEIADFIRKNQIQVEETNYTEGLSDKAQFMLDQFNEEFRDLIAEGEEQTGSMYAGDWEDWAFDEMVNQHGDDFRDAFEVQGNGRGSELVPVMDWNDEISDAAKYYLGMDNQGTINDTRLEYTTQGLENKREIALTVPTIEPYNESDNIHFGDAGGGRAVAWVRFGDTTSPRKDKIYKMVDKFEEPYRNFNGQLVYAPEGQKMGKDFIVYGKSRDGKMVYVPYVNEKQIAGFDTFDEARQAMNDYYKENNIGKTQYDNVLVIDEIQSKRHQDARNQGYEHHFDIDGVHAGEYVKVKDEKLADRISFATVEDGDGISIGQIEKIDDKYRPLDSQGQRIGFTDFDTEKEALDAVSNEYTKVEGVPDAPFEKNWHELAMKRILRLAAEEGYDKVAWTKGEQQNDRYQLSKKIDKIDVQYLPKGQFDEQRKIVKVDYPGGTYNMFVSPDGIIKGSDIPPEINGKHVSQVFGKDLGEKIMSTEWGSFEGKDLNIGGEGMKGFYDQILPRFMDKYGKKWGIKTGEIELPELEPAAQKMWAIDVTPEMKESVMQGQPMFQKISKDDGDNTLMGVHNISEDKLKKAIKQGGLANPSMAVFDTKNYNHTDYGEISLIPTSSLIDSRTGRNAGTYSGDAWTPTYPNVSRFVTKKGDKHRLAIAKEFGDDDPELERHLGNVIYDWVEGNGDRMHWLFLKQKGLNPEIKPERTTHSHEEFEEIQKIFGDGTSTLPSYGRTPEQDKALLDLMTRGYEEQVRKQAEMIKDPDKRDKAIKAMLDRKLNGLVDEQGNLYFAPADSYVYENWRDEQTRNNPKPDWFATDNEASYRVAKEKLSEEYEQWKQNLLNDEDIEEKLFAGWTPDGRKRYVANTVENASRLMNKEADTNAYNNGGLSASKAGLLKKLKTLSEIRKYRHLLKSGEEIKDRHKEMEDEWFDIIHQVSDMQKVDSNPFINVDIAEARLQEAMQERDPIGYMNKEFGYNIARDSELASQWMNFIEEAKQIPVRYFETKFKRPVGLNEFAIAVVPTTTSPEVVKSLEDAGLEVKTYERSSIGDENDQNRIQATKDAVSKRSDIMFQRTSNPEPEMTPEERQYWNKWSDAMKKWRERNAIPETENEAPEKPKYQPGENALDYAQKLVAWNRKKSIWQTAPKLEDYRKVREDKDVLEAARENEKRYPDSPSAKMRRVAAELQQIRSAMNRQKAYDKATVKAVTDFAQEFMKMGFGDELGRNDVNRILSSVKNATGAKDIKQSVDNIMRVLTDNYLKNLKTQINKLASVKELKQTAQGVDKQGKLELKGQRMIQEFRKQIGAELVSNVDDLTRSTDEVDAKVNSLRERLAQISEYMDNGDPAMWEEEYEGANLALQYFDNIARSQALVSEYKKLREDAVKNYKTSGRDYKAQMELLDNLDKAIEAEKINRIGMYGDLINKLHGNISESIEGAHEFNKKKKERVKRIHTLAARDMDGVDADVTHEETWKSKLNNSAIPRLLLSSMGTFEQMLKTVGRKSLNGNGWLYNEFMRGFIDSADREQVGREEAFKAMDDKVSEIFGKKMRLSDLYGTFRNTKEFPEMTLEWLTPDGEMKKHTVSQLQLLDIYMWNKQPDGAIKLREQGITDEKVEEIKKAIDPRLIQLADWFQSEFSSKLREKYSKVYERVFGAAMPAVENYFPLRIIGDAITKDIDVTADPNADNVLPSNTTGSIIRRKVNTNPLDILGTDAVSLMIEHIDKMEKWAAFVEWYEDINALLSYNRFKNQVKNMGNTIYGSGDKTWENFRKAAQIAAGTYRPSRSDADKAITTIASGVTGAKIAFRPYTALKQLLSSLQFMPDASAKYMAASFMNQKNFWHDNIKWAMENLPVLRKRWHSRDIGDTRLMDKTGWGYWDTSVRKFMAQYGMAMNGAIDVATCAAGARAIYRTRYDRYIKEGYDKDTAHKKAIQDAEIGYNLTQQSSEGAFVSPIQKDRTLFANMWTVFRNSSMSYTRQSVTAVRNLKHLFTEKDKLIDTATKQMVEDGIDEDQARKNAEAEYKRAVWRNGVRLATNAWIGPLLWELGSKLPYLAFGDDDEEKKKMFEDALAKELVIGPTEGFVGGQTYSSLWGAASSRDIRNIYKQQGLKEAAKAGLKAMDKQDDSPLPLFADMGKLLNKFSKDEVAGFQELVNIAVQMGTGLNPQTLTDPIVAAIDWSRGDMDSAKEIELFLLRLLMIPQESAKNIYIDELGMNADEAKKLSFDEAAERYSKYMLQKSAPMFGWAYSDQAEKKRMDSYQKRFTEDVQSRMGNLTDEEVERIRAKAKNASEKDLYAKESASRKDYKGMSERFSQMKKDALDGDFEAQKNLEDFWSSDDYNQYKDIQKDLSDVEDKKKEESTGESSKDFKYTDEHNSNTPEGRYKKLAKGKDEFEDWCVEQISKKTAKYDKEYKFMQEAGVGQHDLDNYYKRFSLYIEAHQALEKMRKNFNELRKGLGSADDKIIMDGLRRRRREFLSLYRFDDIFKKTKEKP